MCIIYNIYIRWCSLGLACGTPAPTNDSEKKLPNKMIPSELEFVYWFVDVSLCNIWNSEEGSEGRYCFLVLASLRGTCHQGKVHNVQFPFYAQLRMIVV